MRTLIAGGGIGGLATALSLHAAGLPDVTVYESATAMRELGVGINLLPHAVRELTELGLRDALAAEAIPTAHLIYFTKHGQEIWREPRGMNAGYHWPQFSIHRGALLRILFEAAAERLGTDRIVTGHRFDGFRQEGGRVHARFENRKDGSEHTASGDLLVGADGIHSHVRSLLHPSEGPPKWNGVTMWRGVSEGDAFLDGQSMVMAGTFARRIVVYPISRAHRDRGEALINWVAEVRMGTEREMPPQEWEHSGDLADVLRNFGAYRFPWLDFPDVATAADQIFQYPMVDRDPLPSWGKGRVTLVGDAAHPMYPVGSNGASQAILDARILALHLAKATNADAALAAYEEERRPATAKIVELNRQVGPEQCMELVAQRAPEGFKRIEDVISRAELEEIASGYKRAAGFDRDTLNNRASFSIT